MMGIKQPAWIKQDQNEEANRKKLEELANLAEEQETEQNTEQDKLMLYEYTPPTVQPQTLDTVEDEVKKPSLPEEKVKEGVKKGKRSSISSLMRALSLEPCRRDPMAWSEPPIEQLQTEQNTEQDKPMLYDYLAKSQHTPPTVQPQIVQPPIEQPPEHLKQSEEQETENLKKALLNAASKGKGKGRPLMPGDQRDAWRSSLIEKVPLDKHRLLNERDKQNAEKYAENDNNMALGYMKHAEELMKHAEELAMDLKEQGAHGACPAAQAMEQRAEEQRRLGMGHLQRAEEQRKLAMQNHLAMKSDKETNGKRKIRNVVLGDHTAN